MAENANQPVWNPEQYNKEACFVSALGLPVIDLLAPKPGEYILDLGCGEGTLAVELMGLGCRVMGVDASEAFVAAARARGIDAYVMDGHELHFSEPFDAIFTNAALHWMIKPDLVIAGVHKALKPGGRFVGECGGEGNVAYIVRALEETLKEYGIDPVPLNPWYFPSAEEYTKRLEKCGFTVKEMVLFDRPTSLPHDITGWLAVFAQSFTRALPEAEQYSFIAKVKDRLHPILCSPDGTWVADYKRLRFYAVRV